MTFKKIGQFVKVHGIEWKKYVGVCSNGARAMTGKYRAAVAQIKEVAPDAKCVHCSIHREAVTARKMPAILKTVLTEAVKVVNFIKIRATNSRLFSILCSEMGSEHDKLLQTEVRWAVTGDCVKPSI
jgi:hypothetical protein